MDTALLTAAKISVGTAARHLAAACYATDPVLAAVHMRVAIGAVADLAELLDELEASSRTTTVHLSDFLPTATARAAGELAAV